MTCSFFSFVLDYKKFNAFRSSIEPKGFSTFPCPLYTCTSMKGQQDLVTYVQIPIGEEATSKWVLRGVRLTCEKYN